MRRFVTTMLFSLCVALAAAPAARAQSLLFDYLGFDYESPNPDPLTFGEAGSGYVGVGTVPFLFAPLVSNTAANEYTYVMQGLTPASVQVFGPFHIVTYSAGSITIYEDARLGGTPADFGSNPPSAVAPATFTDGSVIVVGALTNFQFVFDSSTGSGSFEAVFSVTGGAQFANFPLNQRQGWTFSGATSNALNIPQGYAHQIDGQTFLDAPSAARRTSWGQLKAGYR